MVERVVEGCTPSLKAWFAPSRAACRRLSSVILWILLVLVVWLAFAFGVRALLNNPREDVPTGLAVHAMRLHAACIGRARYEGREHLPTGRQVGPLIVVANHTAGVDPLLIQAVCRFEIKFMMAADMMMPWLNPLWEWTGVIPIHRGQSDMAALRAGIRQLESGGVLGIFPEGRIVRERRVIEPFIAGLGLMVRKTGARVLPVTIEGTPVTPDAFGSLFRFGNARVRFHPIIDYSGAKMGADAIAEDVRRRMLEATGWSAGATPSQFE